MLYRRCVNKFLFCNRISKYIFLVHVVRVMAYIYIRVQYVDYILLQRLFDFVFQTHVSCTTAEGARSALPWAALHGAYACGNAVRPSAGCAEQTVGYTTTVVSCTSPVVCPEST